MHIEMVDVQGQLEREIADPRMKRADVALTYAFGLRQEGEVREVDWRKVNEAIIERWSMAGLKWIKTRAWKLLEGQPA